MTDPLPPSRHAACYLRSSKDRSDLSIDAQRRALHEHAREQGMILIASVAEVVRMLANLRAALETDLAESRIQAMRDTLHLLIQQVELNLETRQFTLRYRLATGVKMASPRCVNVAPVCWVIRGVVPVRRVA